MAKTLNAIDSPPPVAQRFRYLYPDPNRFAIVAKARGYDMKVIADDQFVNAKGKPMDTRSAGDDGGD